MLTTYAAQIALLATNAAWNNATPQAADDASMTLDPRFWLVILASMALAPFLLTMITSFVKLVVVGSIVRTALGTQQVPPTIVITGLALILTIHVMWPVGNAIYRGYDAAVAEAPPAEGGDKKKQNELGKMLKRIVHAAQPPMRAFLQRHSHPDNVALFRNLREKLQKAQDEAQGATPPAAATQAASAGSGLDSPDMQAVIDDVTILIPAFVLSELTEAFQIGFLIFIPFLIIDLVVSNVLLAMGMMMLSPQIVSLPLKLLLFVLIDGWQLIIQGVVMGYT